MNSDQVDRARSNLMAMKFQPSPVIRTEVDTLIEACLALTSALADAEEKIAYLQSNVQRLRGEVDRLR